ncbi:unnamed protein product [Rotaria sp. Silwood2]|nr:unnamed protein product [Rotaria sp. Silwood2]CAF3393681.1 unnamed protein product [Rotaria sp. Silwood2]CAF4300343.1 unnamed protein product [Rotaria sp. Silwood2]CAF4579156.1 unnamed protein product [Rotaria sp. Silwood2]
MATLVEIIKEKSKQILLLWESKRIEKLLTTLYADDACFLDNGVTYNGHDELLKVFEKIQDIQFEVTSDEVSVVSDDSVIQALQCKWDGADRNGKVTWKKIDNDWKVTCEEWY